MYVYVKLMIETIKSLNSISEYLKYFNIIVCFLFLFLTLVGREIVV